MSSRGLDLVIRLGGPTARAVALESTLLVHGVPKEQCLTLAHDLASDVRAGGGEPVIVGVVAGIPTVGLTGNELQALQAAPQVPKANTANLGALLHRRSHAATTVSTTMELAAAAGISLFATGAIGGVHRGFAQSLDISADLAALTRFPVAVVTSGVKSLLDVAATREALETLGIPVVGFRTDDFPAFYLRSSPEGAGALDARFDDPADLAAYLRRELGRTDRGVVVANPIPSESEIGRADWMRWLEEAEARSRSEGASGRTVTPSVLRHLHEVSKGRTLVANIALARSNARLAGRIAACSE